MVFNMKSLYRYKIFRSIVNWNTYDKKIREELFYVIYPHFFDEINVPSEIITLNWFVR
jgi:hypothetical protein